MLRVLTLYYTVSRLSIEALKREYCMSTIVTIDDKPLISEVVNLFLQSKGYIVPSPLSRISILIG